MSNDEAAKLATLNGLAGNYSATLAPETSKMWLFLLQNYTAAQVQAAALNIIRKHSDVPYRSMPPFAMMQAELDAMDNTVRGEKNVKLQAEAEWNDLLDAIEGWGSWRGEPDLHPVTSRVVRMMGGWTCACKWLEKDLNWRHKEFCELWEEVQGKEEFLLAGAEGIKRLELPAAEREKVDIHGLQKKLFAMPENVIRDKNIEPQKEEEQRPILPTDYIPQTALSEEEQVIRASLIELRDKIRRGNVEEAMTA